MYPYFPATPPLTQSSPTPAHLVESDWHVKLLIEADNAAHFAFHSQGGVHRAGGSAPFLASLPADGNRFVTEWPRLEGVYGQGEREPGGSRLVWAEQLAEEPHSEIA